MHPNRPATCCDRSVSRENLTTASDEPPECTHTAMGGITK